MIYIMNINFRIFVWDWNDLLKLTQAKMLGRFHKSMFYLDVLTKQDPLLLSE